VVVISNRLKINRSQITLEIISHLSRSPAQTANTNTPANTPSPELVLIRAWARVRWTKDSIPPKRYFLILSFSLRVSTRIDFEFNAGLARAAHVILPYREFLPG
jgi:hypothetical protein